MARTMSQTTTDHETIRRWVEERGGWPAAVTSTARGADDPGIIRIDFPGYSGEGELERVDWDTWFEKFDRSGLAFVYQDTTGDDERSSFNKLVARETAAARAGGKRTTRRASATRARGKTGAARGARASARGARKPAAGGTAGGGRRGGAAKKASPSGRRGAAAAATARTAGGRAGAGARKGTRTSAGGRAGSTGGRRGATARKAGARTTRRSGR